MKTDSDIRAPRKGDIEKEKDFRKALELPKESNCWKLKVVTISSSLVLLKSEENYPAPRIYDL